MRTLRLIIFIVILFFSNTLKGYTQPQKKEIPDEKILYLELTSGEKSKIEKADILLQQAEQLFYTAYSTYDTLREETWAPADKKMKEAVKTYNEAITTKFDVYDKHIKKFLKDLSGYYYDELDRAKYYENKSNNFFRLARLNKKKLNLSEGFYEEFEEYYDAFHNEMLAILNMGRALRIYQDWPVQYDYDWDDYKQQDLADHHTYNGNPNTNVEVGDTVKVVVYDTLLIIVRDTLRKDDYRITFRVQIAAHHTPLTRTYLRTLYKGNERIFMIQEEGWYKYSIRSYFTNLNEAIKVLNSCNVSDAFITGYQYGQKLEYKEAVRLYNLQKQP